MTDRPWIDLQFDWDPEPTDVGLAEASFRHAGHRCSVTRTATGTMRVHHDDDDGAALVAAVEWFGAVARGEIEDLDGGRYEVGTTEN